MKFHKFVKRKN